MTTVGVRSKVVDRVHAMEMPSYSYHYPHIKRVQLSAVKEGVFHPNLPTFRRMDMDDTRQLLTDEHSRTTTLCGPADFARMETSPFHPPAQHFASLNLSEMGRAHHRLYTTPDELKKTRAEWSEFLCRCPERYDIKLPELPNHRDLHFSGYGVRYLRPDVTRTWKPYTLQTEPNIHMYDQKPTPATEHGRYRDPFPSITATLLQKLGAKQEVIARLRAHLPLAIDTVSSFSPPSFYSYAQTHACIHAHTYTTRAHAHSRPRLAHPPTHTHVGRTIRDHFDFWINQQTITIMCKVALTNPVMLSHL